MLLCLRRLEDCSNQLNKLLGDGGGYASEKSILPFQRRDNLDLVLSRDEMSVERRLHQHVEELLAQNTVH